MPAADCHTAGTHVGAGEVPGVARVTMVVMSRVVVLPGGTALGRPRGQAARVPPNSAPPGPRHCPRQGWRSREQRSGGVCVSAAQDGFSERVVNSRADCRQRHAEGKAGTEIGPYPSRPSRRHQAEDPDGAGPCRGGAGAGGARGAASGSRRALAARAGTRLPHLCCSVKSPQVCAGVREHILAVTSF